MMNRARCNTLLCWTVWLAVLTGCAATEPPPLQHALQAERLRLPRQVLVTEIPPSSASASLPVQPPWLVVVQPENQALRWSRFNLLGAPDARQILDNGRWRNDGFIAPNAQAREMFAALLFAWTPRSDLDAAYGAGRWHYRHGTHDDTEMQLLSASRDGRPRWRVVWPKREQTDIFSIIRDQDGVRWDVRPIKQETLK